MGSLTDLTTGKYTNHLTYCEKGLVNDFILGQLRKATGTAVHDVVDITSKRTYQTALDISSVLPLNAEKWLMVVSADKVRADLPVITKTLSKSQNAIVWYKCSKYIEYKTIKELIPSINDRYITYLTRSEISNMLDGWGISTECITYLYNNYSNDVDSPFKIISAIKDGYSVNKPKDISEILGVSSGTIETFVFSLLSLRERTDRGRKMEYKRIIKNAEVLSSSVGTYSMKDRLYRIVGNILAVKTMYLAGDIYDRVPREGLPEQYEKLNLSKYNRHLNTIKDMKLTDIHYLRVLLGPNQPVWFSVMDVLKFINEWFSFVSKGI